LSAHTEESSSLAAKERPSHPHFACLQPSRLVVRKQEHQSREASCKNLNLNHTVSSGGSAVQSLEHAHALFVCHAQRRRSAPFSCKRSKPHLHLCTRGDPTVALSNQPSSLSVGNTSPRVEVYSPIGGDAMSGGIPLVHPARPRAARRWEIGAATNAETFVHDARPKATAVEDASMIGQCQQLRPVLVDPSGTLFAKQKERGMVFPAPAGCTKGLFSGRAAISATFRKPLLSRCKDEGGPRMFHRRSGAATKRVRKLHQTAEQINLKTRRDTFEGVG